MNEQPRLPCGKTRKTPFRPKRPGRNFSLRSKPGFSGFRVLYGYQRAGRLLTQTA